MMVYVVGSDSVCDILSVTLECRDAVTLLGLPGLLVRTCCCFQMYSLFVQKYLFVPQVIFNENFKCS